MVSILIQSTEYFNVYQCNFETDNFINNYIKVLFLQFENLNDDVVVT